MFSNIYRQQQVHDELNRFYQQAIDNGLDAPTARAFASGSVHEQLSVVVRAWQDCKENELNRKETQTQ